MTPQETDPDLPVCPGVSGRGMGRRWPAAGSEALSAVRAWNLLKEDSSIFITSTGEETPGGGGGQPISTENCIKDLLKTAPPNRTRSSFPLSQSLPSGSFHKPLILIHQRADWKPQSQKTNQTDHMDHNLV